MLDAPLDALKDACSADLVVVSGLLDNRYATTRCLPPMATTPCRLLHSGVLAAVRDARQLTHPATRVWPPVVTIKAQLLDLHTRTVAGFDLTAVNAYRWYPGHEPLDNDLAW